MKLLIMQFPQSVISSTASSCIRPGSSLIHPDYRISLNTT